MTTMKITAPTTSETAHPLYFDLIRLVEKLSRQSRDKVVPTLDPNLYNPNNFWQQTYRWSQVSFVYLVFLWFKVCKLVILYLSYKEMFCSENQERAAIKKTRAQPRGSKLLLLFNSSMRLKLNLILKYISEFEFIQENENEIS